MNHQFAWQKFYCYSLYFKGSLLHYGRHGGLSELLGFLSFPFSLLERSTSTESEFMKTFSHYQHSEFHHWLKELRLDVGRFQRYFRLHNPAWRLALPIRLCKKKTKCKRRGPFYSWLYTNLKNHHEVQNKQKPHIHEHIKTQSWLYDLLTQEYLSKFRSLTLPFIDLSYFCAAWNSLPLTNFTIGTLTLWLHRFNI